MTANGEDKDRLEEEPVEAEGLPDVPVFLRDEPPTKKKMDMIKWGLMHNISEEDLVGQGFNPKTVRMAAYDLEKENYRKRVPKSRAVKKVGNEGESNGKPAQTSVAKYGSKPLTVPTKPIPPEYLIDQISLPMEGAAARQFEQGLKFGASMLILGVRVAQELGNMGLQQARPIMDMANAMRQGEAAAAKNAAAEAAMLAAEQVREDMLPIISSISKTPSSGDPMKQMMVRTMEPLLARMMNTVMPGMGGGGAAGNLPSGWTRETREK